MTTYGDQVFQFGGVPVGGGALAMGIMGGGAKSWFVDPANGLTGNGGAKQDDALASVGAAYAKTTDKQGDTIYYLNDGNTTGSSREATIPLVWSNDNTHLVGCCAPTMVSQRARITPVSTAALTAEPVLEVSGHGNSFVNLQIAHWGADTNTIAARGVEVTGSRNYFENCHIVGVPNAHTGDEAAAVDLYISGSENTFVNCVIGADTVVRTAANSCVTFAGAGSNNIFKNCIFNITTDAAAPFFVNVGRSGIDRYVIFDNCIFANMVSSGATDLTAAFTLNGSPGGMLIVKDCMLVGAADWTAADNTNVKLLCNTFHTGVSTHDVANMGIASNVDVTAA